MHYRLAFALALACALPTAAWADLRSGHEASGQGNLPALSRIKVGGGPMRTSATSDADFAIASGCNEKEVALSDCRH